MPHDHPAAETALVRQRLADVRKRLLRLHKALIDAERGSFERSRGPITSGQLLQALISDPYFEWLRPFSALIVGMDEAMSQDEPISVEQLLDLSRQARALTPTEPQGEDNRYDTVCQRDPDALIAHVELTRALAAAEALGRDVGGGA